MSLESLKVQIIKKAWEDPAFKKSLLADPKKAIGEAFGVEIPEKIELKVVEETPTLFYLAIPPQPEEVEDGASNVQLIW
ncbi:NHLP leader peptide family natural product precursor [Cohnella endophytica]|uniref:NHLP leader peptide family natural product n=1 Tax=Cohnella endophytica TaxID=2419778 RepID=A0A494XU24_9BACL|nr:NHLP leader peptide family RiPP precursor [Cohnella endophytica]RKP51624.1 NHLP leader peptide family natural product precursor [Cohnella endophytica]